MLDYFSKWNDQKVQGVFVGGLGGGADRDHVIAIITLFPSVITGLRHTF